MTYGSRDMQRQLNRIERAVNMLLERSGLEIAMELDMAINFDNMAASLEKVKGAEASTNKLVTDLNAKLDQLAQSISNPEDQAKVEEFAAAFAEEADKLPKAVAANPDTGASAGGVTG